MVRRKSDADRVEELEQLAVDIWCEAQDCDGSRASQQSALDSIQEQIESEIPDVADRESSDQADEEAAA
jgi:hypothetical protein